MAEPAQTPTKKSTTKKAATKATTKKAATKRATTTKATTTKATNERKRAAPKASAPRRSAEKQQARPSGTQAAVRGAHQLVELTGKEFEGIVGVRKGDDGWSVQVEVLEMRRIPSTTDVLAVYEVDLDGDGDLVGYRRADRYVRGSAGEDRS